MTNSPQTRHSSDAPRSSATSSWSSVRYSEATSDIGSSELPEDSDDTTEDLHVLGIDRPERAVLGLQPDPSLFAVERLDRRLIGGLVVARQRDHDLAVPGVLGPLHDHEIAVEYPRVDHRFALNPQQKVALHGRRHRDVLLDVLLREQRPA